MYTITRDISVRAETEISECNNCKNDVMDRYTDYRIQFVQPMPHPQMIASLPLVTCDDSSCVDII
jgi:hypothetical protein